MDNKAIEETENRSMLVINECLRIFDAMSPQQQDAMIARMEELIKAQEQAWKNKGR